MDEYNVVKKAKKAYSRVGTAIFVMILTALASELIWIWIMQKTMLFQNSSIKLWITSFLPLYLIAFPVGMAVLHGTAAESPRKQPLGFGKFFSLLAACFPLMYVGNIIGNLFSDILSNGNAENALDTYIESGWIPRVLFMVILAPILEEFIFRKMVIDRIWQYGEKIAVVTSALIFALFHINLFQFFYALGIGLIFAYVYLRTGKLRYTIIMHAFLNFLGSVVAPIIISLLNSDSVKQFMQDGGQTLTLPWELAVLFGYMLAMLAVNIAGIICLIYRCKRMVFLPTEQNLPSNLQVSAAYWNVGMILYVTLSIFMMAISAFSNG